MHKNYRFLILFGFLLFLGSKQLSAQCPQFFDFQGNLTNTPQFVSCDGNSYTLNLIPDLNIGNYTIDWGDGSPVTTGNGWLVNTAISYTYPTAIANYTVTITLPDVPCVVIGTVVMEEPSNASIQIPFGGLTSTCAPGSLDFTNSSTDTSPNTVFTWDFGDGSPILTFNSTNAGQTMTHTYLQGTVNCQTQVILTAENVCNTIQGGQSTATFGPIRIWDIDDAAITASAIFLCYPDTVVTLQNTTNRNCLAQGNIAQRYEYWNLGDYWGLGYDSILNWNAWPPALPFNLAYPGIGSYTSMLVDSSFCGLDTTFITIQIVPPPTAGLTISKDTICEGEIVSFNNLSAGGANTYSWNFGDGTGWINSGGGSVNHTYNFTGDYMIQLAAFIAGGTASCTDTATILIHVLPSPTSNFNFDNNNGCDSMTVNFTNFSSANSVTWTWDFGNGNSSNLQNPPQQFYPTPGAYTVILDVSSINGCVNTLTQVIDVFQSPVPAFTPTSVCMNEIASFTDLSTSSAGDPIINWSWDFGDGNSASQQNPTHIYTTAGPVSVILDVNTANCSASDTVIVTVENAPVAAFSPSVTSGCSPLTVNFSNTSSANAVSFYWNFGNGDTSTVSNPNYIYINNSGLDTTFNVMMIAQTLFGCVDTTYQSITVFPNPIAAFTNDAILDCAPLIVNFTNTSIGGVSYLWDFGDGSPTETTLDPTHTYNNLTQFIDNNLVTLIVTSLNGCTDTIIDSVLVFPEPQFGFSTNPDSGCSPLPVIFPSVIGAVQYLWNFGDGGTSVGPTPSHTYVNSTTNNVTYTIQLIATSPFGCVDTTYGDVLIFPNPTAQFAIDSIVGCHPLPVNFTNSSTGGSLFHWNMGDGTTFDTLVSNFGHTFLNATGIQQSYQIELVAETTKGCKDTTTQNVIVYPDVTADFNSDTASCSPFNVNFINASVGAVNFSWDFGDGSPMDMTPSPTHQYVNNGVTDIVYTSTLIIQSAFGCFDTIQKNITVYATPQASFIPTPLTQLFPSTTVSVNNTTPIGAWNYAWNFGDTTFSNSQNPPPHVYNSWGIYDITLIVSSANCIDSITQTIVIDAPPPIAVFTGPAQGCRPLEVQFVNNSQYADTYLWNFGDGATSTQQSPNYTYYNSGVYTVSLTVFGPGGQDTQIQQQIIEVYQLPNAFFTINPSVVFIPAEPVLFFNLSTFANSYFWDFGDGNTSTDLNPEHFYSQLGVYDITLIATTPNNCIDTFILQSAVEAKSEGGISIPNAFSPNPNGGNGGFYSPTDTDNDVFHPIIIGAEEYELNIFNKWGELLFISTDQNIGWDGYYREELSKQDVYVYKIKVKYIDGRTESFVGDLTLLR